MTAAGDRVHRRSVRRCRLQRLYPKRRTLRRAGQQPPESPIYERLLRGDELARLGDRFGSRTVSRLLQGYTGFVTST